MQNMNPPVIIFSWFGAQLLQHSLLIALSAAFNHDNMAILRGDVGENQKGALSCRRKLWSYSGLQLRQRHCMLKFFDLFGFLRQYLLNMIILLGTIVSFWLKCNKWNYNQFPSISMNEFNSFSNISIQVWKLHIRSYNVKSHWKVQEVNSAPE